MALVTKIKVESQQADRKLKEFKGRLSELQSVAGKSTGALSSLESAIGMNLTSLTKMGAAFGAVAMATKVAKDAFMSMESNIDELGRTTESCKAAYDVFTNSLATGNWDGFIKRLTNAIKGARDLYDALDRLGSVKSNNQAAIAIVQQEIQRLRLEKKQGKDVDAVLQEKIDRLAELQNQAVTAGMSAGRETISTTLTNRGVPADRAAAIVEDILQNGQEAFDRYAAQYAELKAKGTTTVKKPLDLDSQYYDTDGRLVTYREEQEFNSNNLLKAEQVEYEIARVVTEGETKIQEGINTFAQAVQLATANKKEEIKGVGYVQEGSTSGKASTNGYINPSKLKDIKKPFENLNKEADALTKKLTVMPDLSIRAFSTGSINDYQAQLKEATDILNGLTIGTKEYADQLAVVKELQANIAEGKKIDESMNLEESLSNLNSLVGKIDSISSSVENLKDVLDGSTSGFKAFMTVIKSSLSILESAAGIMQMLGVFTKAETVAIEGEAAAELTAATAKEAKTAATAAEISGETAATTASGVSAAASGVEASADAASAAAKFMKAHAWIPYVGAAIGGAAITAMIIAINKAKHFADGGIVPGVENGGRDTVSAVLSPGELVLNKSQQANLASHLSDNSRGGQVEFRIKDRELYGILSNYQNRQSNKL